MFHSPIITFQIIRRGYSMNNLLRRTEMIGEEENIFDDRHNSFDVFDSDVYLMNRDGAARFRGTGLGMIPLPSQLRISVALCAVWGDRYGYPCQDSLKRPNACSFSSELPQATALGMNLLAGDDRYHLRSTLPHTVRYTDLFKLIRSLFQYNELHGTVGLYWNAVGSRTEPGYKAHISIIPAPLLGILANVASETTIINRADGLLDVHVPSNIPRSIHTFRVSTIAYLPVSIIS